MDTQQNMSRPQVTVPPFLIEQPRTRSRAQEGKHEKGTAMVVYFIICASPFQRKMSNRSGKLGSLESRAKCLTYFSSLETTEESGTDNSYSMLFF